MLNIGRKQKLVVVKKVEFGIYLGETREAGEKERVLLPIKQVPEGTKEGDELEVFLYRDSSDRLIATTREPKLVLGELAVLNVAATGKIGAFLDWGLEKDLFLPFKQQTRRLHPGDEVLVSPLHRQERPSLRNDEGLPFPENQFSVRRRRYRKGKNLRDQRKLRRFRCC